MTRNNRHFVNWVLILLILVWAFVIRPVALPDEETTHVHTDR